MLTAITSPDFPSADDAPKRVAILMHGYGSNEHDLAGLNPYLPHGLPWASLRAPLEMGYGAAAWFYLRDGAWLEPGPIVDATAAVWEWIDAHVPSGSPIAAMGFSQGGLMTTQLLRTRPERVSDAVVLSGFVLDVEQPGDATLADSRPAVFWGRGSADQVVTHALVADAQAWFESHVTLAEHVYVGLGHSVSDEELAEARRYLSRA